MLKATKSSAQEPLLNPSLKKYIQAVKMSSQALNKNQTQKLHSTILDSHNQSQVSLCQTLRVPRWTGQLMMACTIDS